MDPLEGNDICIFAYILKPGIDNVARTPAVDLPPYL